MLEHAPHDGHDAHILGVTFHAWDQARYPANKHDGLHARLRRLGDLVDDLLVGDRVRFEEQPARLASTSKLDLVVDVLQNERLHLQGRHPQHVVVVRHVLKRHVAEELRRIAADRGACRDKRQVGVELRRLLVVIARAELRDVLDAVVGLAGDAADLAVHLVVAETVDDVASGLLKTLRPFDVVALVEAGAQLEQRGDLLAVLGGVDERLGEVRLAGQAVERDLDRDDARVARRLAQKLHERVHALVGVGKQHVAACRDLLHDGAFAVEACRPLRRERRIHKRRALLFGKMRCQTPGEAQIERHRRREHLMLLQVQAIEQQRFEGIGELALAFEAHRG